MSTKQPPERQKTRWKVHVDNDDGPASIKSHLDQDEEENATGFKEIGKRKIQ